MQEIPVKTSVQGNFSHYSLVGGMTFGLEDWASPLLKTFIKSYRFDLILGSTWPKMNRDPLLLLDDDLVINSKRRWGRSVGVNHHQWRLAHCRNNQLSSSFGA